MYPTTSPQTNCLKSRHSYTKFDFQNLRFQYTSSRQVHSRKSKGVATPRVLPFHKSNTPQHADHEVSIPFSLPFPPMSIGAGPCDDEAATVSMCLKYRGSDLFMSRQGPRIQPQVLERTRSLVQQSGDKSTVWKFTSSLPRLLLIRHLDPEKLLFGHQMSPSKSSKSMTIPLTHVAYY